ncbi:MAG: VWA domain-containing protein [Lentimicrobiaceae bacterium]|nr:VWA domain-containing protein [Lentimicrobiaceae bacterium]
MFRFENEYVLYALLLIPILLGGYVYVRVRHQKIWNKYGDNLLLQFLMPEASPFMQHLKLLIVCLIWTCLTFAAANPQLGSSMEKGTRKGIDIMFCIDVSNSMLAEDYPPNRIESAKRSLLSFIDKLKGDRIGVVIFAGTSFVQLPITSDYAAAKMFINNISPRLISAQGTDIASAIDKAAASMMPAVDEKGKPINPVVNTQKVIVVVSDGEDHFQDAVDMAKSAAKKGMLVYTVGIGSTIGEPIPIRTQGGRVDYKKDNEGNTVITRLNEQILQDIAQAGNGIYIHADNAHVGFDVLINELSKLEKSEIEDVVFSRYDNKFYIPLWIALILLVLEILLYNKRMFTIKLFSRFKNEKILALFAVFVLSVSVPVFGQTMQETKDLRKGNKAYSEAEQLEKEAKEMEEKGRESDKNGIVQKRQQAQKLYEKASTDYLKSNAVSKNNYKSLYNQSASLYRQKKYEDAVKELEKVLENSNVSDKVKAKAYHNLGNSLLQQEKYQESIEAYKKSLKANPKDMDTKYNLEYARKKMIAQQQQQSSNNDKNEDKNQDQQQQQQQGQPKDDKENQENKQQQAAQQQRKEDAKRQLDALQQNEKRTQEKVKEQENRQTQSAKQEKDW